MIGILGVLPILDVGNTVINVASVSPPAKVILLVTSRLPQR